MIISGSGTNKKATTRGTTTVRNKKGAKDSNKAWLFIQSSDKYRSHVAIETCRRTTETLKSELFDGMNVVLNERNSFKSAKKQKRLMRRIIEKRQAQATHHKIGRTVDLFVPNINRTNVSRCMCEFA